MKASEVIEELQRLMREIGTDAEVLCQSHGCCNHGHDIKVIERGGGMKLRIDDADEANSIVIRV